MLNSREIWGQIKRTPRENYIQVEDHMLRSRFEDTLNAETYFKDFDMLNSYVGWIYDDSSERKDLERKFLQVHPDDSIRQGEYIHWNNGTWICLGVDTQYANKQKGMIYECLDENMNWIDEYGYHSFPFFSLAKVLRDPLSDGRAISLVEDTMEAYLQNNEETIRINENVRFAFGVDSIFRVIERIDYAIDNTLKIIMKKDERRPTDNFIDNIAENTIIQIIVEPLFINGNIGGQQQLMSTIRINGKEDLTKTIVWSSSDPSIATINSFGLVSFVSLGICNIVAEYNGIKTTTSVECTATPIISTEYIIEPLIEIIPIGKSYVYTINKYVNGILVPDSFTITDMTVSSTGYEFNQITSNTYSLKNVSNNNLNVEIEASNGIDITSKIYKLRTW